MVKLAHRFSVALAACTLFLIFVGGLVTSTQSGLSVPDWPLSYGRLMPPMVGGIFYEHGHRMVAATVGLLTILLAIFLTWKEDRLWIKKAAWAAVGLVILQGVLGGLTVLFRLPKPISIAHACMAQTFFCLTVCLAVWTSPFWRNDSKERQEPTNEIPLHRVAMALVIMCFIQLIFGATLRHMGQALPFHISGAFVVGFLSIWLLRRVRHEANSHDPLRRFSIVALFLYILQISLGVATYFLLTHTFDVIPTPFPAIAVITAHVAIGALLLGVALILALISYKTRPSHTAPLKTTLSDYFTLTKPGISFMAGITALAGFVLGSGGNVHPLKLFHTCVGTLMAAAGAGCLNMLLERDLDAQMARTKKRPLPSGRLNPGEVLFLGVLFSSLGVLYLGWAVNILTGFFAALTLSVYLYIYTPLKKISAVCVTVGAVAGALPPVMGWTAATGRVGVEALVLFGILFFWQFPHFLSLAWLYKDDYALAGLHMLPKDHPGDQVTTRRILIHSVALLLVSCLPTLLGLTGLAYLATAVALGVTLTVFSVGFFRHTTRTEAKRVFLFSLLYIPLLVALMLLNGSSSV